MPGPSRPTRRRGLLGCALASGALLTAVLPGAASAAPAAGPAPATPALPSAPPVATTPDPSGPAGPVLFGTVAGTVPLSSGARVDAFQNQAGRPMATLRTYASWDTAWPDPLATYAKAHGQTLVLSVKTKTTSGAPVSWRGIADARPGDAYDVQTRQWAQRLKAYGDPVLFTLNHEPEVYKSDLMGGPADYVAAWRRVVTVFQQEGVRNVEYLFIGTAFGWGSTGPRAAAAFYPGDEWVDDIGADGYNWYDCRPTAKIGWVSPVQLFEPFRQFGLAHPGKGLVIGEYGTVEDPAQPGRKAQWFADLQAWLKTPGHGQFRAVADWYGAGVAGTTGCNWRIDTSPSALAAFRAWGADPQYAPAAVAPSTVRQVAVSTAPGSATVSWAPAGPGGAPVTTYTVVVSEAGQPAKAFTTGGTQSSLTWAPGGPLPATATFTVSARNGAGTGRPSTPVSATVG